MFKNSIKAGKSILEKFDNLNQIINTPLFKNLESSFKKDVDELDKEKYTKICPKLENLEVKAKSLHKEKNINILKADFTKGAVYPPHNHPNMIVMTYILSGKFKIDFWQKEKNE